MKEGEGEGGGLRETWTAIERLATKPFHNDNDDHSYYYYERILNQKATFVLRNDMGQWITRRSPSGASGDPKHVRRTSFDCYVTQ